MRSSYRAGRLYQQALDARTLSSAQLSRAVPAVDHDRDWLQARPERSAAAGVADGSADQTGHRDREHQHDEQCAGRTGPARGAGSNLVASATLVLLARGVDGAVLRFADDRRLDRCGLAGGLGLTERLLLAGCSTRGFGSAAPSGWRGGCGRRTAASRLAERTDATALRAGRRRRSGRAGRRRRGAGRRGSGRGQLRVGRRVHR